MLDIHPNPLKITVGLIAYSEVVSMDPWRRKRRGFFDMFDFFGGFDEEFRQMEENMARMFDEMRKTSLKEPGKGGPFVYGFSMKVGPDGKPKIEEFGNVPASKPGKPGIAEIGDEREPLTDVIDGEDEISVIAELPGIEKKDIDLKADEETLSIKVDTPQRKYSKKLLMPARIIPDSVKANYKNGVLEVKIKRLEKKKAKKEVRVKVD